MKTVLITGGSRGIGRACVEKFVNEGYRTAFLYKSSDSEAKKLSERFGALAVKCDVSGSANVKEAISLVKSELGTIDVLVNNAGIAHTALLQDMTDEEWSEILNTNLSSLFYTSREIIPIMLSQGSGVIINVSSVWGITGASCETAYSATKAGVIGFTKALAKELAPSGIRVNAVAPGVIRTDMLAPYTESDIKSLANETPLGKIGTPEEVADSIYFLSSDSARFITGEVINVNGGFLI